MNALLRWVRRHPALEDWLEGASMVLTSEPPSPPRPLYSETDVVALISDMHAVGRDLRRAMDEQDSHDRR